MYIITMKTMALSKLQCIL